MGIGTTGDGARLAYHAAGSAAKHWIWAGLLGVLCAAGCTSTRAAAGVPPVAGGAIAAFPTLKPYFIPGETITWEVTVAGITGARARLAVGTAAPVDGRNLVVLRAEAESAGIAVLVKEVRSTYASWIDAASGVPSRSDADSFGIGNTLLVHAERGSDPSGAPAALLTIRRRVDGESQTKLVRLPVPETHDPLSATLALRAWNAPRGARALLYSLGGARLWRTELTCEGSEVLRTALGKRSTLRIVGVSTRLKPSFAEDLSRPPRTFTLWVTDDDQRIPVQIKAHTEMGDVFAKITSYEAPES